MYMHLHLIVSLLIVIRATGEGTVALPGCKDRCADISIPYPFGTRKGCYLEEKFLVTCNTTSYKPPKLFLGDGNIEVTYMSLQGQLRILSYKARDCYDKKGLRLAKNNPWVSLGDSGFLVSPTSNRFTAVGCDTAAFIWGSLGQKYNTGCMSQCDSIDDVINGSCSGTGCCQTAIPEGARSVNISVLSFYNHTYVWDFNPCSFAFLAEEGTYNFSSTHLKSHEKVGRPQVLLDWAIGNQTCDEARKNLTSYACKENSNCSDFDNGPGYRCNCSEGYEGNPYLPNGCIDINECALNSSPCNMLCHNLPGTYNCSCPEGYEGDGRKNGSGCRRIAVTNKKVPLINIALGLSAGLLVLFLGSSWTYWMLRNRKLMKLKEKFFQQNGGLMLKQQLSKHEKSVETARIFTVEELKKATDNYDDSRIIGQGGYGMVYRGVLQDNTVVAIKKSKISNKSQIEQFINEVVVLAQINHRNVVKLLGCCLETEVPLLVYEFITNGTLSDHVYDKSRLPLLTWELRLKIATEIAGALAYLHSATCMPIIHRDVKSANILLDDNYTAKVSDFGASKLVPLDHTQLATLVQGTFGYLDPEYFHSSQLTEKSDVYSFGVVLAELLTGQKALCFDRPEKDRNLATYFVSALREDRLFQILEGGLVVERGEFEQIRDVAKLAKRCLRVRAEDRPTMREVANELDSLRMMKKHPWEEVDLYPEETEQLLHQNLPSDDYSVDTRGNTSAGYDSLRDQMIVPLDGAVRYH